MVTRTVGDLRAGSVRIRDVVELQSVFLLEAHLELAPSSVEAPYSTSVNLKVAAAATEDFVDTRSSYIATARREDPDASEAEVAWTVKVDFIARFVPSSDDVDDINLAEDDLNAFALMVGAPINHPFARECIQNLTAQSPYPAFTIGMLKSLAELPDDHELELKMDSL